MESNSCENLFPKPSIVFRMMNQQQSKVDTSAKLLFTPKKFSYHLRQDPSPLIFVQTKLETFSTYIMQ